MSELPSLDQVKFLFLFFGRNFSLNVGQHLNLSTIEPGRWTQIQPNHHRSTSMAPDAPYPRAVIL